MPDWKDIDLDPTHLGIFALDRQTGAPLTRLPIYAEIVWTDRPQPPPPDGRFEDLVRRGLSLLDAACDGSAACRTRVLDALATVLPRVWPPAVRDDLAQNTQRAIDVFSAVLEETLRSASVGSLSQVRDEDLRPLLEQALRTVSEGRGLALLPREEPPSWRTTYPLGVLGTDHVGYLSYDLARLPVPVRRSVVNAVKALREAPDAAAEASIWVYPLSADMARFEALAQRRFAHDAIVARLQIAAAVAPPLLRNLGLPALQKPSLTDWRLSPASFAASPAALVGQDGCETLWPANLALQEFHFHQIVRLTDLDPVQPPLPAGVALGIVHDYRLAWYPLGHSLGQILYSLPLAPAESVNLAIIDWTRRDETARTEDTKLNEQIVHDQRRDRTITETVNAAIKEYQEGSNFMAGVAQSAGAAGTIGKFGVATGLAGALGGATSDSSGSRDLAATTVQQLSEHITQASSAMREFQSTVVVRSVQSEKETIETRTIVNYNHSHALTILYYEVLRHFRVTTELVRVRPAVLVKLRTDWFLPPNVELTILMHRAALEAALLDAAYKDAFDAFLRTVHRAHLAGAAAPPAPPPNPGAREFKFFTLSIKTGGLFSQGANQVDIHGKLQGPGFSVELVGPDPGPPDVNLNPPGSFRHGEHVNTFTVTPKTGTTVKWSDIDALWLQVHVGGGSSDNPSDVSFRSIKLVAQDGQGGSETLVDTAYESELVMTQTSALLLPTRRPPGLPGAPAPPPEELADEARRSALVDHLSAHKTHYSRAIVLNQNPVDRAHDLDAAGVLQYVDNRPLEVLGDYIAYPCTQRAWRDAIDRRLLTAEPFAPLDERLVTLPTRGVFAEARLGHCNASEEIDNTRFWDWQRSPIPHFAPEIAPVQPVTPQPQQPNVQPTPFPQSLVNIVNPPSAPDPTGLAAAMTAIASPNIFRDMSGRAEVASLLQRLSDNSIKIAEASSAARGILANQAAASAGGTGAAGGQAGSGSGSGSGGASRTAGGTALPAGEQLDRMQVVRSAVRQGELTPEEGRQEVKKIISGSQENGAPAITLADNTPEARAFFPFADVRGETFLLARTENVPPGAEGSLAVLPIDLPKGGSVAIHPGGGLMSKIFAEKPGVCGVSYQFLSDPVKGLNATVPLSVPLFTEVAGSAAMIDPVFAAWNLPKVPVVQRARLVLDGLSAVANLRFVWTLASSDPAVQTLPVQFRPGGKAEKFLTQISFANVSPSNELITVQTSATGPGSPAFDGKATIHLAQLGTVDQLSGPIAALVARLAATPPDPAVRAFATEFFARLLASYVIRTMCTLVLGPASGGPGGTFAEKTGFELAPNADAGTPGSYVDLGIDAMRLRPDTIKALEELFPVPPAFK